MKRLKRQIYSGLDSHLCKLDSVRFANCIKTMKVQRQGAGLGPRVNPELPVNMIMTRNISNNYKQAK